MSGIISMNRRYRAICSTALAGALTFYCTTALAFGFDDVAQRAMQLAAAPFKNPSANLPTELQALDYDRYRDIRFKGDQAYWRDAGLPFELTFFHRGLYYDQPVKINEVAAGEVREIPFSPALFDYGKTGLDAQKMLGLGFSGFRVHYPLNTPPYKDEVLVFLGASYFRAIGKGGRYGLSARGLALDTGVMSGEEFPRFVEFWIERPTVKARELVIYGLLDSRRATAAYRFVLKPGAETVMEVASRLYLRENVAKLGLAPLTSMYFFGENQRPQKEDFRPEVHNSDGLSVLTDTHEWLWRPLVNPKRLLVTSFAMINPAGFGLMQRDRDFESYEDLDARFELRPSAWVEPLGSWGSGRVELVQIPTPDETNDNIVAFWVPDNPPPPGQPYDFAYRLSWESRSERRPASSWIAQTRRGQGYARKPDDSILFTIDFEGPIFDKLAEGARVESMVWADGNGKILGHNTYRNEASGGWRTVIRLRRVDDDKPVELRAHLRSGNRALSESWNYILPGQ
ncbi:MAG TPA: glucan biosynthesis protein G [Burkholderiales bacterium]|nr:glucan biosynthesis protein G [Burkholderiales bacterium]